MADNRCKGELKARLDFWQGALKRLREAYLALVEGGVKSYALPDRQLTRLDLPELKKEIVETERRVDELTAALGGVKPRRAFGVVPRDF